MDLNKALAWRYATTEFDLDKEVSEEDLQYILEGGNLMPTSYGLQPFRFIVIKDAELKERLVEHSYGQRIVADNSHLIVIAVRTDFSAEMIDEYVDRAEKTIGLPEGKLDGLRAGIKDDILNRPSESLVPWAQKQAYIALGGMIAAASEKGIDNHALEGFSPEKFNEILYLKDQNLHASVLLSIGYRAESDSRQHNAKVRVALDEMVIEME